MSDLAWQKIFDLQKKVDCLVEFQKEQAKINANLIKLLKGLEEKK